MVLYLYAIRLRIFFIIAKLGLELLGLCIGSYMYSLYTQDHYYRMSCFLIERQH